MLYAGFVRFNDAMNGQVEDGDPGGPPQSLAGWTESLGVDALLSVLSHLGPDHDATAVVESSNDGRAL